MEVSGWWETPCSLSALHHWDFLPQVDLLGMRDFCVTRQEEPLALARAIQCCVERLGRPPRVLCRAEWDLQRCMAPLMWLDSDEIIEASLLGPANNRPITPPTTGEEAVLLGDEPEPQEALEVTTLPPEHPKTPKLEEAAEQSDTPSPPVPPPMASNSPGNHSWNTRRALCRARVQCLLTLDPDNTKNWVQAYLHEQEGLPSWW